MDYIEYLSQILEKFENFTISEALTTSKNTFDLLCIVNYLLDNIVELARYEIETNQHQQDFEDLKKSKIKF